MSNEISQTILELEKMQRYAEAGYGRIFAYQSLHFNAMIDARTKAKRMREHNPLTWQGTQFDALYSGPTVFFNKKIDIKNKIIVKADLISAYPSYLLNDLIKKPGVYRRVHKGAVPLSDRLTLYVVRFKCEQNNPFVDWFLNNSAINLKKVKSGGGFVWGDISIFSNTQMNLIQYVAKFLKKEQASIVKSYTYYGKEVVNVDKMQIMRLFDMKSKGDAIAKQEMNSATGWLSHVDKSTYYHMIQYIKWALLKTTFDNDLIDSLVGVQTDCLFYVENDDTIKAAENIKNSSFSVLGVYNPKGLGAYKFERVESDKIITYNKRVVVGNGA